VRVRGAEGQPKPNCLTGEPRRRKTPTNGEWGRGRMPHGVGGLAWARMGLGLAWCMWGRMGMGLACGRMGLLLAWGWHGVVGIMGLALAWGWHGVRNPDWSSEEPGCEPPNWGALLASIGPLIGAISPPIE
jgi:hypothetical protein